MKAQVLKHKGKVVLAHKSNGKVHAQPYSLKAAKQLRDKGYKVGSLEQVYDYPGPYDKPRDCQRAMVRMGLKYRRFFNLSEMRTGKTSGTLWMLDIRMRYMALERVLIVAPLGTIEDPWKQEIFDVMPHVSVYYGTGNIKKLIEALRSDKYSMFVINPSKLHKALDALMAWDPQYVVVDEMMEFKNPDTTQYLALEALMSGEKARKRGFVPLSGTLGSQSLTDIWTSARFINPKTPKNFGKFKDKVLYQPDPKHKRYLYEVREGAEQYVASLLTPSVRYRTDDVNDMPKHEGMSMRVGMSANQKRMFKEMLRDQITEDGGKVVEASHAAVKLWKLMQIASGVVYSEDGDHVCCGAPEKIEAVKRLMRDTAKKTVIFSGWDCQQEYLMKELKKAGYNPGLVNGKVSTKGREELGKAFQQGDINPLICHPRITKHGKKYHAASNVIFFGPRTSTEEFVQGAARIRGPGTGPTMWVELSASAIEEHWFGVVNGRNDMKGRVLDLYREVVDEFT